ncbi:MAG: hypothetical protein MJZ37_06415 [Bacilli bacterium]|nr:hypothetical protein [Bacilli bacterium]
MKVTIISNSGNHKHTYDFIITSETDEKIKGYYISNRAKHIITANKIYRVNANGKPYTRYEVIKNRKNIFIR